jgi:hypothetical protein
MAKTSTRRHHAKRIQDKWIRLSKHLGHIPQSSLSFGKIFHQDPLDCGNPNCQICSASKINDRTRQESRKIERFESYEIS